MALIGQNDSQREGNINYIFPCTPQGRKISQLTLGACVRVTVVIVCVCVCVTELAATYFVYTLKVWCHQAFYAALHVCIVWISLKSLCSKVLARFTNHLCLLHFLVNSRWTKETAMASFRLACITNNRPYNSTDSSLVTVDYQQSFLAFQFAKLLIRHMHSHAAYTYYVIACNCTCAFLWSIEMSSLYCILQLLAAQVVQDLHNTVTLQQAGQLASAPRVLHESTVFHYTLADTIQKYTQVGYINN